jgi:hypothetical protein
MSNEKSEALRGLRISQMSRFGTELPRFINLAVAGLPNKPSAWRIVGQILPEGRVQRRYCDWALSALANKVLG